MRWKIAGLLGGGVLVVSAWAWAGAHSLTEITFGTTSAYGTVPGAYSSADNQQYINCVAYAYGPNSLSGDCFARTSTGAYRICIAANADQVHAAASAGPGSYIYFNVAPDGYYCSTISVSNGSLYVKY